MDLQFTTELFRYPGDAGWYFARLPPEIAEEIRDLTPGPRRGFGSVRVEVAVGASTWRTSVFPDSSSGSFLLPVKRAVRVAEGLDDGAPLAVRLRVIDR